MGYELIITEKPSAAKKIAEALADGKPVKESQNGVPYYLVTHGNKDLVVVSAVGHLYTVAEKEKGGWTYPIFDMKWVESSDASKAAAFTKKYLTVIKKLAKKADSFTVATDYDIEGEVIGLNIIKFACKQKDASRMKFSTLTKGDLIKSYEGKSKTLDWGQGNAGVTRHELDWLYGINLSRALTLAVKHATNSFKLLSSGRVQGPALKLLVDKEKAIKAFKPDPYWMIQLLTDKDKKDIEAWHKGDKFWEKPKAEEVFKKAKQASSAEVKNVEVKEQKSNPPVPFDLTSLQIEAHKTIYTVPKRTLELAQALYIGGYISYPRTSSQKLPKAIGFSKILTDLKKQDKFSKHVDIVLAGKMVPNEGKKIDDAHPAIYPTGVVPSFKDPKEADLYELIVRRFLAVFGEPATRESMKVTLDANGESFIARGIRTKEQGWFTLYDRFVMLKDEELPKLKVGEKLTVRELNLLDKETQPPKRYTAASIIKELEKQNLGTKCLTPDTLIKIKSNGQIRNIKIAELFDDLCADFPIVENGMKIAINNKKACFSFDESDEIESHFKLVSKRKLNKNEKVCRIEYKDGNYIELTEEHPILIFDKDICRYVPVTQLKKGMKSVTSIKFPDKKGDTVCIWDDFLKNCSQKTKLYSLSDELLKLRKKLKLSQQAFGKKYNVRQSSICIYEKYGNIPLYIIKRVNLPEPMKICSVNKNVVIKNPFPLRMTSPLARILANLVGDGSIDTKKIMRENCYDFRYHNTNIDLINKFIKDVKTVFGVNLVVKLAKPKPGHLPKYYVRVPAVVGRIISILFNEVIKKNAVKISSEFYPDFVGSLFDDEGHASPTEQKLFISNTNFELLEDVKQMLAFLGITALLDKKQFKLYIRGKSNLKKFLDIIPFASVSKKQRLIDNLTKKYSWKNSPMIKKERDILALLGRALNNEMTLKNLSAQINLPVSSVKQALQLLRNEGFIERVVRGTSNYPRKIITYKLIKSFENIFYMYIGERVLSPDFITKTINSVKKIDYNGFVYDITNSQEIPNFILSNGVVVHNSTRAQIIENLYNRGYVNEKSIEATELGIITSDILEKYCPLIQDAELTREFEEEMEEIRKKKKTPEQILDHAKKILTDLLTKFKAKEKEIGKELAEANKTTRNIMTHVGKCPKCKEGELQIRKGRFGKFIACNKYPDCETTFGLPTGIVKPTDKVCETCSLPVVKIIKKRSAGEICINPKCPSKITKDKEALAEMDDIESGKVEKECPDCKEGNLVVRKSIYGAFLGCNRYPKCRHTERLGEDEDSPLYPSKAPKWGRTKTTGVTSKKKRTSKKKTARKKTSRKSVKETTVKSTDL